MWASVITGLSAFGKAEGYIMSSINLVLENKGWKSDSAAGGSHHEYGHAHFCYWCNT